MEIKTADSERSPVVSPPSCLPTPSAAWGAVWPPGWRSELSMAAGTLVRSGAGLGCQGEGQRRALLEGVLHGDRGGVPSLSHSPTPFLPLYDEDLGECRVLSKAPGVGAHAHFADKKAGWEGPRPPAAKW